MGRILAFSVLGIPVPQGSKRAFNGVVVDSNATRLRPWRQMVSAAAAEAMGEPWLDRVHAFKVRVWYNFPRPSAHYSAKGGVKPSKENAQKTGRPDVDKLIRATLDSLTDAGVWMDDSQVVEVHAFKQYGTLGGLDIEIEPIEEEEQ